MCMRCVCVVFFWGWDDAIETRENRADSVSDQIKTQRNKTKNKEVNLVAGKGSESSRDWAWGRGAF